MSDLAALLRAHRFAFHSEDELQRGIASVLTAAGIVHEREVRIGTRDRLDFLLADGTAIETKLAGSRSALLRQLDRYTQSERVSSIVVVTNLARLAQLPTEIGGKPVRALHLLASCL